MFEKTQQKFGRRNTCTPMDASQVRSNCGRSLNKEETLGVNGLKTFPNISEENLPSKRGQGLRVPVGYLHSEGKPSVSYSKADSSHTKSKIWNESFRQKEINKRKNNLS